MPFIADIQGDGGLQVEKIYAYATAASQKNGAIFGVIKGGADDTRIVSAKTDIAQRTELHTHLHEDGVMMMREVEGYDVGKGDALTLEPAGDHIMIMGLKAPLKTGDVFTLILETDTGEAFETHVTIVAPGSTP